jgi:hypothetical protein
LGALGKLVESSGCWTIVKFRKHLGKKKKKKKEKDGGLGFGDFRDCKKLLESSSCCIIPMSRKYLRKKREIGIWRSLWTLAMSAPTQYTILLKTNPEKNNNTRIKA